jgi:uncharacterized protein YhbP (UPF0306 family)
LAETLRAMKFYTVESVAFASDDQISKIGLSAGMAPMVFRDRAKAFLTVAKDATAMAKKEEETAELKKRLAELEALVKGKEQVKAEPKPVDAERDELAAQYQAKFGKKPHHKMSAATIREKLGEQLAA